MLNKESQMNESSRSFCGTRNDEWNQWTLQQYVEKDAVFFAFRGWLKLKSVNKYTEKDF